MIVDTSYLIWEALSVLNAKMMWANHRLTNMTRILDHGNASIYKLDSQAPFGKWSDAIKFRSNRVADVIAATISLLQIALVSSLLSGWVTFVVLLGVLVLPSKHSNIWHNIRYAVLWVSGLETLIAITQAYTSDTKKIQVTKCEHTTPITQDGIPIRTILDIANSAFQEEPNLPDGFRCLASDDQSEHFHIIERTCTKQIIIAVPGLNTLSFSDTLYALSELSYGQLHRKIQNLTQLINQNRSLLNNKNVIILCQSMGTVYGPVIEGYLRATFNCQSTSVVSIEPRAKTRQLIACQDKLRQLIDIEQTASPVRSIDIFADPNHWNSVPFGAEKVDNSQESQERYWVTEQDFSMQAAAPSNESML